MQFLGGIGYQRIESLHGQPDAEKSGGQSQIEEQGSGSRGVNDTLEWSQADRPSVLVQMRTESVPRGEDKRSDILAITQCYSMAMYSSKSMTVPRSEASLNALIKPTVIRLRGPLKGGSRSWRI